MSETPLDALFVMPPLLIGARLVPGLTLTETGFLHSTRDGETYSLNPSSVVLLRALERGVSSSELWHELARDFALPPLLAQRDAKVFLARLFELGLLELTGRPGPTRPAGT